MKAIIAICLGMALVVGCKQNPFPTSGKILTDKPKEKDPILPPLVLDLPDSFDFREGEPGEFTLKATVPAPGTPVVEVQELPPGAAFNGDSLTLSWTPDFAAGNETGDPTVRAKSYVVTFILRSSIDAITSVTRKIPLVVRDVPRPVTVDIPTGERLLEEGKEFVETVKIDSADFPKGPFTLNFQNLPQAAKVTPVTNDPTQFKISYTPDLKTVTVLDQYNYDFHYKYVDVEYAVILPSGNAVKKTSRWKIKDSRQHAAISLPKDVVQGLDVNFSLVAEDANGEGVRVSGNTHPLISLPNGTSEEEGATSGTGSPITAASGESFVDPLTGISLPDYEYYPATGYPSVDGMVDPVLGRVRLPHEMIFPPGFAPSEEVQPTFIEPPGAPFGKLTVKLDYNDISKGDVNPVTIATVRWNQIPADKIGTTQKLKFRVCVNRSRYYKDHCTYPEVTVKFDAEKKPAPIIDRTDWPLARLRYIKENETITVPLKIKDGEPGGPTPTVVILPDTMRQEVTWVGNKLTLSPKSAGIRQFNVVATSAFGVTQSESFIYEVLPWSWSTTLILGESPANGEVKKTMDLFEDPAVANPLLQPLDDKLLALRNTLIISTSALSDPAVAPELEKAAARIKNVILMSPLLGSFGAGLKDELAALKVTVGPRFLEVPSLPGLLKDFEIRVAPSAGLTNPSNAIKLGEAISPESKNPLTLTLENGSRCTARLNLTHPQLAAPLLVAATCKRSGGGTLVVSGVEWADFVTSLPDAKIAKKWMSEVVVP